MPTYSGKKSAFFQGIQHVKSNQRGEDPPDKHYQPAAVRPTSGPPRAGARRSLRDVPADPAVYRVTTGFETELAVEEAA